MIIERDGKNPLGRFLYFLKRRRINEATEAQQVASTCAFIDRLRAMGDFRQAKIHYGSVLQIRRTIEHETS